MIAKNPGEPEFHQAVKEVLESLRPVVEKNEEVYRREALLERITEPDRLINVSHNLHSPFFLSAQEHPLFLFSEKFFPEHNPARPGEFRELFGKSYGIVAYCGIPVKRILGQVLGQSA